MHPRTQHRKQKTPSRLERVVRGRDLAVLGIPVATDDGELLYEQSDTNVEDISSQKNGRTYEENITLDTGDTLGVVDAGEDSDAGEHGGSDSAITVVSNLFSHQEILQGQYSQRLEGSNRQPGEAGRRLHPVQQQHPSVRHSFQTFSASIDALINLLLVCNCRRDV